MAAQITTRAQVNGYRFLLRRLEHALIRGDSRMIHDPMRGQMRALAIGIVISVLVAGASGVLAFFKPAPNFGQSAIMLSTNDGGLFVRIGGHLHPALNLASARLIAGKPDPPQQVDDKFLNTVPLGPTVGIVGAPSGIYGGDDMAMSSWTVCDDTKSPSADEQVGAPTIDTTVLANDPPSGTDIRPASPDQMMLAKAGDTTFLIYDGVRAAIDPTDPVLHSALRLADSEIREVSPGLLNAFPQVDPILPIAIRGVGQPAPYLSANYPVGSIVSAVDSRGGQLYVVLPEGVQPISAVTADIIRYGNPRLPAASDPISPATISAVPVVHTLRVDHYPAAMPRFIRAEADEVVCMSWQRASSAAQASIQLLIGHDLPMPSDAQPVRLATADDNGPGVDDVYLKAGTGEYVQSTGDGPDSRTAGQLYYVSDLGLRFHINDAPTATTLGVVGVKDPGGTAQRPQLAPWSVLSLLPPGPELSQQAALIAHDGIAADQAGSQIAPPKS